MSALTKSSSRGRGKKTSSRESNLTRRRSNPSSAPERVEIIVNVSSRETRIALLEEGELMEYRVEREERVVGSIFKGIVQNVLPGMDAAFIDIGLERNAFLHVGDLLPEEGSDNSPAAVKRSELRRRKIKELIRPGQQLMVQVIKGSRGTKGARVTSRIALPGRYVVLLPDSSSVGVSRKIESRVERERLRRIGDKLIPDTFGLILRTECEGRTEAELRADIAFLQQQWATVLVTAKRMKAPACVHRDQTLLYRTVRDMFGDNISSLAIDNPDEYEKVHLVATQVAPSLVDKIQLYDKPQPIFDHFDIERQLDRLIQHKVYLKSGAYLVIDEMEALTAIDINTGRQVGSVNLSDTIVKANLEAVDEVLRQVRLRDMGGIIVVDFIDMEAATDRKRVLDKFTEGLTRDRARTRVGKISSLGLVEITRKRTGESITETINEVCPLCEGIGRVTSKETVSLWIERDLFRKNGEPGNAFLIKCHPSVVEALIGGDGASIEELEHELRRGIYIRADFDIDYDDYEIISGTIEQFDHNYMRSIRVQALQCNVRRSELEGMNRIIGWTDDGYFMELIDADNEVGHRVDVVPRDIRRSFAVAQAIKRGQTVAPKGIASAISRNQQG